MLLLARAPPPPPPLAASCSATPERALRFRSVSSSRAAVATVSAAAKSTASTRGGQKRKQVASVANPLVKHCVKLRLSAAYRRSCRRLLLVGLAPILYALRFHALVISTRPAA
jgi:TrmH family RNA methyltransferase